MASTVYETDNCAGDLNSQRLYCNEKTSLHDSPTVREFRFLFSSYPEGIGPKVDKFELLSIASTDRRHFIRIRSEKDLDKAIKRAVNTSIGKFINLIRQLCQHFLRVLIS